MSLSITTKNTGGIISLKSYLLEIDYFYRINCFMKKRIKLVSAIFLALMLTISDDIFAEGTKQFSTSAADVVPITNRRKANDPFASADSRPERRLNVNIKDPANELLHFGFSSISGGGSGSNGNFYFRIKDPSGNIVYNVEDTLGQVFQNGQQGWINNYSEIIAGPVALQAGGYNGLSFQPLDSGTYYFEFDIRSDFSTTTNDSYIDLNLFDITVEDKSTNNPIDGRLWAMEWSFINNPRVDFQPTMYFLTTGGVVTSVTWQAGNERGGFELAANTFGLWKKDSLPLAQSRKSSDLVGANIIYQPELFTFFNNPDPTIWPSGSVGEIDSGGVKTPHIIQCNGSYFVVFYATEDGEAEFLLNFNGLAGYQTGTTDTLLISKVVKGKNLIPWSGKDGQGTLLSSGSNIPMEIAYKFGLTHLVHHFYKGNTGGFLVQGVRPTTTSPSIFWDDSEVSTTNTLTSQVNLTGCTGDCRKWQNPHGSRTLNTWWFISTDSMTVAVTMPEEPVPTVVSTSIPSILCEGDSISLGITITGDSSTVTFQWAADGTNFSTSKSTKVRVDSTTLYTIALTNTSSSCTVFDSVTVQTDIYPDLRTIDSSQCQPASIDLANLVADSAGATGTIQFFTDSGLSNPATNASAVTASGKFYVTQATTSSAACRDTDSITINVFTTPSMTTTTQDTCYPGMLDLTSQGIVDNTNVPGTIFGYYSSNSYASGDTLLGVDSIRSDTILRVPYTQTVYVRQFTPNGCESFDSLTATVNPSAFLESQSFTACQPEFANLDSLVADTSNVPGAFAYFTNRALTNSVTNADSITSSGTYYAEYTATQGLCTTLDSISVTINATPNLNASTSDTNVCFPNTVDLTNPRRVKDDANTGGTFQYRVGDVTGTIISSPSTDGLPAAITSDSTRTVAAIMTTTAGCSDSIVFTYNIKPSPQLSNTITDAFCGPTTIEVKDYVSDDLGLVQNTAFTYSIAGLTTSNTEITETSNIIATANFNGCTDSENFTINITIKPDLHTLPQTVCYPSVITLDEVQGVIIDSNNTTVKAYLFSDSTFTDTLNPTTSFAVQEASSQSSTVETRIVYVYKDAGDNCKDTATIALTFNPTPSLDYSEDAAIQPIESKLPNTVDLTTTFIDELSIANSDTTYLKIGDNGLDTVLVPKAIDEVGELTFIIKKTTAEGCVDSIEVDFEINPAEYIIPTAFSPNGDGFNNDWTFKDLYGYGEISVEIFNRWGLKIFEKTYDPENESDRTMVKVWDGKKENGTSYPVGTYYYTVKANGIEENGSLLLVR